MRSVLLENRRLFIFASRAGFLFLGALLIMLLTAVNYQNNMGYALTFWLTTMAIVAIHHTHGNLLNLRITAVRAASVFPGQQAEFVIRLEAAGTRAHRSIRLEWPESDLLVDVPPGEPVDVSLFRQAGERGWFTPGRLRVESRFPVGLLRCWSFVDLDLKALVYPRPVAPGRDPEAEADQGVVGFSDMSGHDDLLGFRDYRPGDSPRHVDWRAYAREQALQTRLYSAPARQHHRLSWEDYPGVPTEQRLSWLCHRALVINETGDEFGLTLPGVDIPLGSGDRHCELVLRALALHGLEARG